MLTPYKALSNTQQAQRYPFSMSEPTPAVPDYLASPNAVFNDEGVEWRYGRAPDYTKTRKVWEEGKSTVWHHLQRIGEFSNRSQGCLLIHHIPCRPRGAHGELRTFLASTSLPIKACSLNERRLSTIKLTFH